MVPPKGSPSKPSPQSSARHRDEEYTNILPQLPTPRSVYSGGDPATAILSLTETMLSLTKPPSESLSLSLPAVSPRKPLTPRTEGRREKGRRTQELMSEAQRALRPRTERPWNPDLFVELLRKYREQGRWEVASGMRLLAAEATIDACKTGTYKLSQPRAGLGHLPSTHTTRWMGFENTPTLSAETVALMPPFICTDKKPLELLKLMKDILPGHSVTMSCSLTDFTKDGTTLVPPTEAQGAAQQDLLIRTNLQQHMKNGQLFCQNHGLKAHLTAASNPFVMAALDVTVFRGSHDEGYPFLSDKEQLSANVVVSARSSPRVRMAKGENFLLKDEQEACKDRLTLLALAAVSIGEKEHFENIEHHRAQANEEGSHGAFVEPEMKMPILIISMHDLVVAGSPQPRRGIANLLKDWRQLYCDYFEAVIVACGDQETAAIFDKCINAPIYASVLIDPTRIPDWHWNEKLLDMAINPVLMKIRENYQRLERSRTRSTGYLRSSRLSTAYRKSGIDGRSNSSGSSNSGSSNCLGTVRERKNSFLGTAPPIYERRLSSASQVSLPMSLGSKPEEMSSKERFEKFLEKRLDDTKTGDSKFKDQERPSPVTFAKAATEASARAGMEKIVANAAGKDASMAKAMSLHGSRSGSKVSAFSGQAAVAQLPEEIKAELTACLQKEEEDEERGFDLNDLEEEIAELKVMAAKTGQDLDKKRHRVQGKKHERKLEKIERSRTGGCDESVVAPFVLEDCSPKFRQRRSMLNQPFA